MRKLLSCLLIFVCACSYKDTSPKPLVFFVLGDWGRRGSPSQVAVADEMNRWAEIENPDFVVTTGDNFYDVGVADVNDSHWSDSFQKVYSGDRIKDKTWYATLGNHDYMTNPEAEIAYTSVNSRWQLPAHYYQKIVLLNDGTKIRLAFIDSSPFEKSYYASSFANNIVKQDTTRQKKWLDSLMQLNDVDWKIAFGHHHIYTGGLRKSDPNSVRISLEPIFEKNKVDAYFCGHEHDLQHLKAATKPTHYFLSGTGSDVRPTGMIAESLFAKAENGFMSVTVSKHSLEVKVINDKGEVLYSYKLNR